MNYRTTNNNFKLIIFDLDGTLVDTVPDLAYSLNQVLAELGHPTQKLSCIMSHMGNGMHQLIKGVLSEVEEGTFNSALVEHAYKLFLENYTKDPISKSKLYPEVSNTIEDLGRKDIKIACVTNKLGAYSKNILEHFEIHKHLSLLLSGDSLDKKKPDSMPLTYACDYLSIDKSESLMVGDSEVDVYAAKNAGMQSVYMKYGYGNNHEVAKLNPDYSLEQFQQLLDLVDAA